MYTSPSVASTRVMLWATVNAVITSSSWRGVRMARINVTTNSTWSMPPRMWRMPW